jgi:hypothetical protein
MQPNTLARREYEGKIYVKIIKKIHVDEYGSEKIHSRSTTLQ